MYHTIEFNDDLMVDFEISRSQPLERIRIRKGARARAQVKPYVTETPDGPTEVADLFFDDGTATRAVPFELFSFVD
jgi:hypothetical protein